MVSSTAAKSGLRLICAQSCRADLSSFCVEAICRGIADNAKNNKKKTLIPPGLHAIVENNLWYIMGSRRKKKEKKEQQLQYESTDDEEEERPPQPIAASTSTSSSLKRRRQQRRPTSQRTAEGSSSSYAKGDGGGSGFLSSNGLRLGSSSSSSDEGAVDEIFDFLVRMFVPRRTNCDRSKQSVHKLYLLSELQPSSPSEPPPLFLLLGHHGKPRAAASAAGGQDQEDVFRRSRGRCWRRQGRTGGGQQRFFRQLWIPRGLEGRRREVTPNHAVLRKKKRTCLHSDMIFLRQNNVRNIGSRNMFVFPNKKEMTW